MLVPLLLSVPSDRVNLGFIFPSWHHGGLPESFMSSSDATLTLMSWLRMLPSWRGLPGTAGASWPRLNGGHLAGLNASSASGSSFTQNPLFSASFWFAAGTKRWRCRQGDESRVQKNLSEKNKQTNKREPQQNTNETQNRIFSIWCFKPKHHHAFGGI